jgi:hypothetical protein
MAAPDGLNADLVTTFFNQSNADLVDVKEN